MFEVFLRKKKIEEFAKEEIQSSKALVSVFIAILILQILVALFIISGFLPGPFDSITTVMFQFIIFTITSFIFIIIAQAIMGFLVLFFAKLVKGTGSFAQFFFKSLYLYAPFILFNGLANKLSEIFNGSIIAPIFGIIELILIIYSVYLLYGLIKNSFNLSTGNAIFAIVAPVVLIVVIVIILVVILGAWFFTQITQVGTAQGLATLFS